MALEPEAVHVRVGGSPPNSWAELRHRLPDGRDRHGARYERWLRSSRPTPFDLPTSFSPELQQEVHRRLGHAEPGRLSGRAKGRVLYLVVGGWPVAVLTYHLEGSEPLQVRGAESLAGDGGQRDIELLLVAARAIGLRLGLGSDELHWDTDSARFAALARAHGFEVRRPRRRGGARHQLMRRYR